MRYVIFIFAMMVLLQGCKKEELNPFLRNSWGWAKAEVNGINWEANACRASLLENNYVSLGFHVADNSQSYESIIFNNIALVSEIYFLPNIYLHESGYPLKPAYMRFMVKGDNDLDCAAYENLHDKDSLQNWVEITEYNEKTKEIKGIFSCNMIINPKGSNAGPKCKPTDPDTIRIRNGVFHTKIMN